MSDLADRLRAATCAGAVYSMMCEAADEIDRLFAEQYRMADWCQMGRDAKSTIDRPTVEIERLRSRLRVVKTARSAAVHDIDRKDVEIDCLQTKVREREAAFELVEKINAGLQEEIARLGGELWECRKARLAETLRDLPAVGRMQKVVDAAQQWRKDWQDFCDRYPDARGFEDTRACYGLAAAVDELQTTPADSEESEGG